MNMKLKLSDTQFLSRPTDAIPEKDVYTVNDKSTITEVKDILTSVGSEVVDAARNTPGLASGMASVIAGIKTGRLTQAQGLQRAMSVLGGSGGVIDKLSAPVKSKLTSVLGPDAVKLGEVLIESSTTSGYSRRGYGDITRTRDFLDIFDAVTGNEELLRIFDIGAEVGLIGAVLSEAIALGIPEAIDELLASAPDDYSRYQIVNNNVNYMILSGDIATVNKAIDTLGGPTILAQYPNFCRDFLSRFSIGLGQTADKYSTLKAEIIAMFVRINPTWDKALRNKVYIPSLLPFEAMSADSRTVFLSTPLHVPQVVLGQSVKSVNMLMWIKEKYPYFPSSN